MKDYGVKDVTKLSGISARTLHYYDHIDLLKPKYRSDAGYRYYGEKELLRLQQILFFKELDFPLNSISNILNDPQFNITNALKKHRSTLNEKKRHITKLLNTIDNTIIKLNEGKIMNNPEELYEGLSKEFGTTYRDQAIEAYGSESITRSEEALSELGKDGVKQLKLEQDEVTKKLFSIKNQGFEHQEVQNLIRLHYKIIRKFWGTSNLHDPRAEAYAGLGQLYVADERFTIMNGKPQPDFARFLQKAMEYFAETNLS